MGWLPLRCPREQYDSVIDLAAVQNPDNIIDVFDIFSVTVHAKQLSM